MGGNPIQFDYTVLFTLLFPIILALIFFVFFVYLMVSAIRFFNRKIALDKELLGKLDELIKLQTQQNNKKF
jgi:hypothetical protein